ncbi:unnamed protein product, partial [marine sediment metagenome]
ILGGYVGKYLKYLQGKVEDFIGRMPIPDLIFSIIGILLGIVIGAPAYLGLSKIQLPSIIGTTIFMFVYLLIILFTTRIVYRSKDRILNLIRKKDKIYVEKGAISQIMDKINENVFYLIKDYSSDVSKFNAQFLYSS